MTLRNIREAVLDIPFINPMLGGDDGGEAAADASTNAPPDSEQSRYGTLEIPLNP